MLQNVSAKTVEKQELVIKKKLKGGGGGAGKVEIRRKKFACFVKSMQGNILTYSGLYITRRIIVNSGFSAHGTLISALQYIITERNKK